MSRIAPALLLLGALLRDSVATAEQPPAPTAPTPVAVLRGHRAGVTAVRFANDGAWLASASLDGTVRLWSTRTWETERTLEHGSEVYAVTFSPKGDLLVSGGYDHRLVFWELPSGRKHREVKLPDWVVAVRFTSAEQLVAGCADGVVRLIDPATGAVRRTLETKREIVSLDVSTDGRYLAAGVPVRIWDLATGELLSKETRALGQNGLAFSPSGPLLASAEGTAGARVLSVPGGESRQALALEVKKQLRGPTGPVQAAVNMPASAVAFSGDGGWLATGGTDAGVQLWRVTAGTVASTATRTFAGHTMTVTGVSFSPDGGHLASASLDRTVRIWALR
jgi:WD40 repeat protein